MSPLAHFDRLLKESMGLDVSSIGQSALARAVSERQRACHFSDAQSYLDCARRSETERQALIEAIVVSETWFFRDREAFRALVQFAIVEWLPSHAAGKLRVLSLPCSTGEEPYSMAMALLDAGISPSRFAIDAVDISQRALTRCQQGVYGRGSFRGSELRYRDRHFVAEAAGYRVSEAVRAQVRFQRGNLFDSDFLKTGDEYDVVFCRNLLIYFDPATQKQAVTVLSRLLSAKGMLFAGSSESALFLSNEFASARIPMAFAFRKGSPKQAQASNRNIQFPQAVGSRQEIRPRAGVRPAETARASVSDTGRKTGADVDEALKLADEGRLLEAADLCEDRLRQLGPTAGGFYLLGLIRDAAGNSVEASACYKKALYLEPRYPDALVHLALLLEQQGQHGEAQLLLDRARRLSPHKGA
jgi:chemotaxis protein methyltransferase WspC